jgi:hypothetical protein
MCTTQLFLLCASHAFRPRCVTNNFMRSSCTTPSGASLSVVEEIRAVPGAPPFIRAPRWSRRGTRRLKGRVQSTRSAGHKEQCPFRQAFLGSSRLGYDPEGGVCRLADAARQAAIALRATTPEREGYTAHWGARGRRAPPQGAERGVAAVALVTARSVRLTVSPTQSSVEPDVSPA